MRLLVLMIAAACAKPPPVHDRPFYQLHGELRPPIVENVPPHAPPPEPLVVTAATSLAVRKIGALPYLEGVRARVATLDLVATVSNRPREGLLLTVTTTADGVSTAIELPEALRVESYGAVHLRSEGDGVEILAIGSSARPGGLARWLPGRGWSTPIILPEQARKELPSEIAVMRVADRWLVFARAGVDHYPIVAIDGSGTHRISPAIAAGAYAGATQLTSGTIGFTGGAILLIDDASTADGKAAGYPGRTRGVLVANGRFAELGAPFPWPASRAPSRIADGAIAAIAYRVAQTPSRLLLVDATGILADLAVHDELPDALRWFDGALVGWGGRAGWILDTQRSLRTVTPPSEAPLGWRPNAAGRIGSELCAWGGAMPVDETTWREVRGAVCLDPRTAKTRLLAAELPAGRCTVLADGESALALCETTEGSTLWRVSAP